MLTDQNIVEHLKSELEIRFKRLNLIPKQTTGIRGINYSVDNGKVHYRCTIGRDWLGYELFVDDTVLDMALGFEEDNDGYGFSGDDYKISQNIFANMLNALDVFANNKLLVGKYNENYIIAMPINKRTYLLKTLKKRRKFLISFISYSEEEISASKIRKMKFLYPPN